MRACLCLLLSAALLSSCGSGKDLPFEPAGPEAAPDPMVRGPFPVGVRTLVWFDPARLDEQGQPRRLLTEIWYPAPQAVDREALLEYDPKAEASADFLGDDYQRLIDSDLQGIVGQAVRDAALDSAHGPYPLVIFSHGAYGIRWQSVFFTEHLASHGYVVVAADHLGNTVWELLRDGFDEQATMGGSFHRLDDVAVLIDRVTEAAADEAHFLYRAVDLDRVGVAGHSFGGFTAATTACIDERIDAAVGQSPLIGPALIFGCQLDTYPVPLLVQGGTLDRTVPYHDQYCDYNAVTADQQYLLEIAAAGHYTFSDICELDLLLLAQDFDFGPAAEALEDGCSPVENVPWAVAHRSANHYALAFFNQILRDSAGSAAYLKERSDGVFENTRFFTGPAPDWPDGGCGN